MRDELIDSGPQFGIREYLEILRRRKAIIIQTLVLVMVVGLIVTFMTKPLYRSTTKILVEGKNMVVASINANDPMSNLYQPDVGHEVPTQLEVIQSASVVRSAMDEAGIPRTVPGQVGSPAYLSASQVNDTDVLEVDAESHNPEWAFALARTIEPTYLTYVTGNQKEQVLTALRFASDQLTKENKALENSANALEAFKQHAGVVGVETEKAARINDEITAQATVRSIEGELAANRARLASLQGDLTSTPAMVTTPQTVTNLQEIQNAQDRLAQLQQERARLLVNYKPNSIPLQKIGAQIADATTVLNSIPKTVSTISRQVNPEVQSIQDRISQAQADVASSTASLAAAQQKAAQVSAGLGRFSQIEHTNTDLQREYDKHSAAVDTLSTMVLDLRLRANAEHDPVLTISAATPPTLVRPQKALYLVLSLVLGLVLGVAFAVVQDFLDDRIRDPEEARRITGSPPLGYVPLAGNQSALLIEQPRSGLVLESFRVLRSNVGFAAVDAPTMSLTITSTVPSEGKSLTSTNLAVAMALDGRRVILVDADLRRPTLHRNFAVNKHPGLTNILLGELKASEALIDTRVEGLRLLTSGPVPPNPAELLNSQAMRHLQNELKSMADVVIFDSPPCLATADAQVLASGTDGVIYVMQFGAAKKSEVRHSFDLLNQAHARMLGIVYNKVDTSGRSGGYYYGYYSHYKYYASPAADDPGDVGEGAAVRSIGANGGNGSHNGAARQNGSASHDKPQDANGKE
ncbi:MAG: polysaccharide biosynthesis tyrosine autokinase [Armatimonadetes bacterium]|nr:polysaccharide biosynthesis tyrosine autokinase [Armatimonadota bacterium]MDE2206603.1 polysaccharide biosynthesis tyrosine autokinase [Armatimonadota bacterium]